MEFQYDEDLVERAVFLKANQRPACVPAVEMARFQRGRERLYSVSDVDERNAAFFMLHARWFRRWGMEQALQEEILLQSSLENAVAAVVFRQAHGRSDEAAELYVSSANKRTAVLAVLPGTFCDPARLRGFLRRELMHIADMVNPDFGYTPVLPENLGPVQQRLVRERYRFLWELTVEGRLSRGRGAHSAVGAEARLRAGMSRVFAFRSEAEREALWGELWSGRSLRHSRLMELASDPRGLGESAPAAPGSACPLCGFTTFDWAGADQLGAEVISAIKGDFPAWEAGSGLCHRCGEMYRAARSAAVAGTT